MNLNSESVISTLANRVSIREYLDKPIDEEIINTILETARRAPTSSNLQAYSIIIVRKKAKKKKLSELAGNQKHVENCGVFIAICADISRMQIACRIHGSTLAQNLENSLVSIVDAAIVGTSISLVAESVGLGSVMIGGMRNHPMDVARVLELPKGSFVVFGLCLGWPDWDRVKQQKPRLDHSIMVKYEEYKQVRDEELKKYDRQLAEHYQREGRHITDNAWTGVIAKRFNNPRRQHLREELRTLGLDFN